MNLYTYIQYNGFEISWEKGRWYIGVKQEPEPFTVEDFENRFLHPRWQRKVMSYEEAVFLEYNNPEAAKYYNYW